MNNSLYIIPFEELLIGVKLDQFDRFPFITAIRQ